MGSYKVQRGAVVQDRGPAAILSEYVVVKINATQVFENEDGLRELYTALVDMKKQLGSDDTFKNRVNQVIREIASELPETAPGSERVRPKRALLPFVGTALKSMFGVSTTKDATKAKERLDKLEQWAAQQGSAYNTVISGVNDNIRTLETLATDLNKVMSRTQSRINEVARHQNIDELLF